MSLHKTFEARKNARLAGQLASTTEGVAGTVAACVLGGSTAVAIGVAAPVILGVGIAFGTYYYMKGN